jgi:hypothetical protein
VTVCLFKKIQFLYMVSTAELSESEVMKAHRTIVSTLNRSVASAEAAVFFDQWSFFLPKGKIEKFPDVFCGLLRQIRNEFGGYSYDREVSGSWMERNSGVVHDDASLIILVAVPKATHSQRLFKLFLSDAARHLEELCIFVSIAGGATFFVWATEEAISTEVDQLAA